MSTLIEINYRSTANCVWLIIIRSIVNILIKIHCFFFLYLISMNNYSWFI
ncbi:hypothetical protein A1OE_1270 [Candidatus Endolissoclinum faulkneri L2]|uniref:Uncharacterized protein n=1 Tax=Candidatus Endolissoclinum faulkneri L2 TaxID=1193729 RepID=K7YSF9_9PROT|nr:hypothetical protein A1OE_1270 [Candidatus Endolissoclinum faulkneri L2]